MTPSDHIDNKLWNLLDAIGGSVNQPLAVCDNTSSEFIYTNNAWFSSSLDNSQVEAAIQHFLKKKPASPPEAPPPMRSTTGALSVKPFTFSDRDYYLVTVNGTGEKGRGEKDRVLDKQRSDALLEQASMGIIETSENGDIINANPFALKLFGYERNDLTGKKIELLIPPRFHGRHISNREEYIQHSRSRPMGVGLDLYAIKKDGTEFPVEVSLSSYQNNGNKNVIAFISDISIRKQAENEIKKLNDQLEQTVEERTLELRNAITELNRSKEELSKSLEKEKELNDLKSKFVSMASHEFRTPLSTVLSSAYLLQKYTTTQEQDKRESICKGSSLQSICLRIS